MAFLSIIVRPRDLINIQIMSFYDQVFMGKGAQVLFFYFQNSGTTRIMTV